MKRYLEAIFFGVLAAVVLIAAFGVFPKQGVQSSGSGGEDLVAIEGATAAIEKMVEAWERPPQPQTVVEQQMIKPPEVEVLTVELPQLDLAVTLSAPVKLAVAPPLDDFVPQVETASVKAVLPKESVLDKPTNENSQRPTARPKPVAIEVQEPQPLAEPVEKTDVVKTRVVAPPKRSPAPKSEDTTRKSETAKRASAARTAQKAAGSGGGNVAGASGAASANTKSAGQADKLKNIWGSKIRARVERRKKYPSGARGKASVVVQLTVSRNGKLLGHRIVSSSGNAKFDKAAVTAVVRAGKFPKAPAKLADLSITLNLPINYSR